MTISASFSIMKDNGLFEHNDSPFAPGGVGVLPYMGYIGMCRCEGYGFQTVYSRIGYINQSVGSRTGNHFSGNRSVG